MGTTSPEDGSAIAPDEKNEVFDPVDETRVIHRRIGVWDFYEPKKPSFRITSFVGFNNFDRLKRGVPHAVRLLHEVGQIPRCRRYLAMYAALGLVRSAVLPAFALWSSSRYLELTQAILQNKPASTSVLMATLLGSIASRMTETVVEFIEARFRLALQRLIERHFQRKTMRLMLSLDVQTWEDPGVQNQLGSLRDGMTWRYLPDLITTVSRLVSVMSQGAVLGTIFLRQKNSVTALINVTLSSLPVFSGLFGMWKGFLPNTTWAATCRDKNFIRLRGFHSLATDSSSRQELIAGNLQDHVFSEWDESSSKVVDGGKDLSDAYEMEAESKFEFFDTFIAPMAWWLPELFFCLTALRDPEDLAQSFASMELLNQATSETLEKIERLYEGYNIQNKIIDGTESFSICGVQGVTIEFRNVTFRYPKSDNVALEDVSFVIPKGTMCVIVGTNGSGKSTLLKLLLRIYEPEEGSIWLDGNDIRTLKLADLRQAIAALFQSFTSFPLSIAEDIGMGDTEHKHDQERIERAAELGGASEVINKLPKKYDTYLSTSVLNHYCKLPKGTTTLFGVKDISDTDTTFGSSGEKHSLSGGEYQRLALSRTFMRTMNEVRPIGLLLFDEPSAALDPEAEYALFERLITLRGSRTMIFSSHRFGKLTKYADVILYMKDSKLLESGTHDELLAKDGGYASMYKVQAEAFTDTTSTPKSGMSDAELVDRES